MSLLNASQHSAQFRVNGDSAAELLRKTADILDDLGEGEYVKDFGYEADHVRYAFNGQSYRVTNRQFLTVEVGR